MKIYYVFFMTIFFLLVTCTQNEKSASKSPADTTVLNISIYTVPNVKNSTSKFEYEEKIFKDIINQIKEKTGYEIQISYAATGSNQNKNIKRYINKIQSLLESGDNTITVPDLILVPEGIEKQILIETGLFKQIDSEVIEIKAPILYHSFSPVYWKHRDNRNQLYCIPLLKDKLIQDGGFWIIPDEFIPKQYKNVHDLNSLVEIAEYYIDEARRYALGARNLSRNDLIEYIKRKKIATPHFFHHYTINPFLNIIILYDALEYETRYLINLSEKKLINASRFYLDQNESMQIKALTEEEFAEIYDKIDSLFWGGIDLMIPNLKDAADNPTNLYRFDYEYPYTAKVQEIFAKSSSMISDLDLSDNHIPSNYEISYFLIPEKCDKVNEVLAFLNKMQEPELADTLYYGIEGTHWRSAGPSEVSITENNTYYYEDNLRIVLSSLTGKRERINELFPDSIKNQYRKYLEKNVVYPYELDYSREYRRLLFTLFGPPANVKIPEELMNYLLGPYSPAYEKDSSYKNMLPEIYNQISGAINHLTDITR